MLGARHLFLGYIDVQVLLHEAPFETLSPGDSMFQSTNILGTSRSRGSRLVPKNSVDPKKKKKQKKKTKKKNHKKTDSSSLAFRKQHTADPSPNVSYILPIVVSSNLW